MTRSASLRTLLVLAAFSAAVPAASAAYVAIDLQPASGYLATQGYGVAGTVRAGTGYESSLSSSARALLWNGTTAASLQPASGYDYSAIYGSAAGQQVGLAAVTGGSEHAALWSSTAAVTDLNPANASSSCALGTDGLSQVGYAITSGVQRAILWNGSAAGAVDLHAQAESDLGLYLDSSVAHAVSGDQKVGSGAEIFNGHAFLWNGASNTTIDLTPAGFDSAEAWGVDNHWQVGNGFGASTNYYNHALVWNDSATNVWDLTTPSLETAYAVGIKGNLIVGNGNQVGGTDHALLWTWDPTLHTAVMTDLQAALPANFTTSFARSVDANGWIIGQAHDASGADHAILWVPATELPEPATLTLLGLGAAGLLARRKR